MKINFAYDVIKILQIIVRNYKYRLTLALTLFISFIKNIWKQPRKVKATSLSQSLEI